MTAPPARHNPPPAVLIAGPTCSGKSALALALARALGGVVINADAMQVYAELRIVTARPTPQDEAAAPHVLYGVRRAAEPGDAVWWRAAALEAMQAAEAAGRVPILCGGTGLYFAALTQGLADIPHPGPAAREEARGLLASEGPHALHARLSTADPNTARRLRPSDSQRLARAWEVWAGTGRGLADWQRGPTLPPAEYDWRAVLLDPPRADLRCAIAQRAAAMMADGAVAEVEALLAQDLPPSLPAMRAHGVPEIAALLRGELTPSEAIRRIGLVTGQYTKRQASWFRHRHIAAPSQTHSITARYVNSAQESANLLATTLSFISGPVDAAGRQPVRAAS